MFLLAGISLALQVSLSATQFYVSPTGNDANSGTKEQPFATLTRAQQAARSIKRDSPITVYLRSGIYYLPATLKFTAEDSGTATAPVIYMAAEGETPVISGGQKLALTWEPYRNGIMKAKVPSDFTSDQLFVNGERQNMARYPNFDPQVRHFNGFAADAFSPERAARWADPRGGYIHAMHRAEWGDFHYVITGKGPDNKVTYEGGWQNNRRMGMHNQHRMVENIFEELDVPGEWFHDAKTGTLYFYPPPGLDLAKATVEAVRLRHLVEFLGTMDKPVKFVTLRGLTFRHAARTFMDNKEQLLRSDWTTYRGGAVFINGTEDCTLEDCFLDQVGGNAVFVNNYNRRVTVRGCHIANAGANGVAFVGDPQAVRNPLFEYNERQDFSAIDKTPGPKSHNYPAECLVEDCLIYLSGRVEKQTAPVQIEMAQSITVRHCSIYDVPRAGINIGDGCWGGHVIEFCDIFDTVKETGDHGSFNSWGRDRYWGLKGVDLGTVTLGENKNLPVLDVVKPNILRNNRWRCDHGWDIDLDDGSSNYELRNNLCLNGGIKLREGFYRICENNIMVNNSFHPHVWYGNSQDTFRRNLMFGAYRPIRVNKPWGKECNYNLLHKPGQTTPAPATGFQGQSGLDANSIEADARFVDAAKGDYRVRDDSPALKLGFQNFPMDQFGVQKPALKALARTPELPDPNKTLATEPKSQRDARTAQWLGATVKNVIGLGEISAAGLPGEIGVTVVEAPKSSAAAKAGLQAGDILLKCNGKEANSLDDFLKLFRAAPAGQPVKLGIWRNQKAEIIEVLAANELLLSPRDAKINGVGTRPRYDARKNFMGSWNNASASLEWSLKVPKAGDYEVVILLAGMAPGNTFEVKIGNQTLTGTVLNTGGWEKFEAVKLGSVRLEQTGEAVVTLKPVKVTGAVMNLRALLLTPKP
ncbi:MAG: PDZ domain-containing protein [Verrucomicrobiota bacterium]